MIEILLDAVKMALSDDARRNASGLIDFIKKSPNWQKDICTLEATVKGDSREYAYLLGSLTKDKMTALRYKDESISSFEYVYRELTANAFEHGCRKEKNDQVQIVIEITTHFVAVTVRNPKGRGVNLESIIQTQSRKLYQDPNLSRGRGIVSCVEYADELTMTPKKDGVKAVFYNPPVRLKVEVINSHLVIDASAGLENPSVARRIKAEAMKAAYGPYHEFLSAQATPIERATPQVMDVVVNFGSQAYKKPTQVISTMMVLRSDLEKTGRKLHVMHSKSSEIAKILKDFDDEKKVGRKLPGLLGD